MPQWRVARNCTVVTNFGTIVAFSVPNMESKTRFGNRQWFQKIVVFMAFGLFTAQARALVLLPAPEITAQPLSTNVPEGDTVTLSVTAECFLGALVNTVNWYYIPAGSSKGTLVSSTSGLALTTVTSSYTMKNVTSANAGGYYAIIESILAGNTTSSTAQLTISKAIIPLAGITSASGMLTNGFKVQFSAPIGSNVVIEATSNLGSWSPVYTNVSTGGSITYTDAVAKTAACRFYRARIK
jgi:hypothetical protein